MSDWKSSGGPVPPRWLHCPRKAIKLIQNKFLAFKTPLSSDFDSQVPVECRFNVKMLFSTVKSQRLKLGLWIDLTNTNRFYDKTDVEAHGCRYLKLQCRGHGETPSEEQTKTFVKVCKNFIAQNPLEIVGIHCTHGFNRTGFLIISYLVETEMTSVDAGLAEFATARPPGIYKGDYIQELFKRYDEEDEAPQPPSMPAWCVEYDDSDVQDNDDGACSNVSGSSHTSKKRKREFVNKNPVFMAGVPGVTVLTDNNKISQIQRKVQDMCGWKSSGFPGSQPVSMNRTNLKLLHEKYYRVSWKADGTRYLLFIQGNRELYFIDRDNSIFQVDGLNFPHFKESRCLNDTLLDGEMVIDRDGKKEYPRYLTYDVIYYDGKNVAKLPFHPNRYLLIEEIIAGRTKALIAGILVREREPFSVRLKTFWDITQTACLLGEKFAKQLSHEPDGLIFQPAKDPYTPGQAINVLKWKPSFQNSVDFKLEITTESGLGLVPRKIGRLFVGGMDTPFGVMKITKDIKEMNNKIIECKFDNNQWIFMRERTDKSFPNSFKTANAVCLSIRQPVTKTMLLEHIDRFRFLHHDAYLMPPPRHEPRHEQKHEHRLEQRQDQTIEFKQERRQEHRHEQTIDYRQEQQRHEQRQEQQRHEQRQDQERHEHRQDQERHEHTIDSRQEQQRHEQRQEHRHEQTLDSRQDQQRHEQRQEQRRHEQRYENLSHESCDDVPVKRRRR